MSIEAMKVMTIESKRILAQKCESLTCTHMYMHVLQVHPEGKYVVDLDKAINMSDIQANCRVALRNDSYKLHKILPNKVRGGAGGREGG